MLSVSILTLALIGQVIGDSSSPAVTASPTASSSASRPTLARTATINGFADPIYDRLPTCAKGCMDAPVGFCPYWEPGCLCVMTFFGDPIAQCWAENCVGEDIVVAASLATSVCHSIGAPDWKISPSLSTVLSELATAEPTITETEAPSSSPEASSTEPASDATSEAPILSEAASSSSPAITASPIASSSASRPTLARTATINGFADPIYDRLPTCAKGCMDAPVGFCPYWEPGCLCVMTFFGDPIAQCWAENCVGEDIVVAASLATSVCHSIGAPDWKISPSLSTVLSELATAIPTITETEAPSSSQTPEVSSTEVSSEATSDASTSSEAASSSEAPVSSETISSSAAVNSSEIVSSVPSSIAPSSLTIASSSAIYPSNGTTTAVVPSSSVTANSDVVVDDVTETVINGVTEIVTVCTKCKTLSGSLTTYTTVVGSVTRTVTAECDTTEGPAQPENGKATVTKGDHGFKGTKTTAGQTTWFTQVTKSASASSPSAAVHTVEQANVAGTNYASWLVSVAALLTAMLMN